MTTLNKVLLGTLAAQIVLVAVTRWPSGGPAEARDLVGFPIDEITSISVTGRKARDEVPMAPVVLSRAESGWVLTSLEGYPAEDVMVQPLLDALDAFDVRVPVATQAASHPSLEVADDVYTRKVDIEGKGGQKVTLYVGASEGKSAHVRLAGEEDVYNVRGVTAWTVAEHANRYFERDVLNADPKTAQVVTIQRPAQPPIEFRKLEDGNWTLDGLAEGQGLEQGVTGTFIGRLLSMRMIDPVGKTVTPEMGLDGPGATTVTWTTADTTTSYRIGGAVPQKENRFYFKSDTSPYVLEVLAGNIETAVTDDVTKLISPVAAPTP